MPKTLTSSGIEKQDSPGSVDSVFSRTGDVVAAASDYDATQVDNDSGVAGATVAAALDTLDAGKAATSHSHTASEVTDFDTEVSNNASVVANTSKVSADGSVTSHSDVTSAGSGEIITSGERSGLHSNVNDPTADQKAAMAGTNGTPADGNRYVTNSDPRNTDARTPTTHTHAAGDVVHGTAYQVLRTNSGATDAEWGDDEDFKTLTIDDPTAGDEFVIYNRGRWAIEIVEVTATVKGGTTPSVTFTLKYGTDVDAAGTDIWQTAGSKNATSSSGHTWTSFDNSQPAAADHLWGEISAASGSPDSVSITVWYKRR